MYKTIIIKFSWLGIGDMIVLLLIKISGGQLSCDKRGKTFSWSYTAHKKALSSACKEPPTKGQGGEGSLAIHHPTGILAAFSPLLLMNLKSFSTINVLQCS